jgi:hypothetical protein
VGEMKKKCTKCGVEKDISLFHKYNRGKYGVKPMCKQCTSDHNKESFNKNKEYKLEKSRERYQRNKEYHKQYRENNKENNKKYRENNKEYFKEYNKQYRENNKEYLKKHRKEYLETNKESMNIKRRKHVKERYNTDSYFRFNRNIRSRITRALKLYTKHGKTMSCAEYGIDFGMIYDKVGPRPTNKHELDHIIAISKFNLDIPEHVRLAHLPENLQWLPKSDNLSKSDKIPYDLIYCSLKLQVIAKKIGVI